MVPGKPINSFTKRSISDIVNRLINQKKWNTSFDKKLIGNFFYLSLFQVSQFLLPLLIIPYLVNIIGYERTGMVFYIQSFMSYFIVFSDYGFNLSATQEISLNRNDGTVLNRIFSEVISTKVLLIVVGFLCLFILTLSVKNLREERWPILLSYSLVVSHSLFPIWFFQGIEQMKYITYLNFLSKVIFVCLIFLFIKSKGDYIYVNCILGIGGIVSSVYAYYIIYSNYKIAFRCSGKSAIVGQLNKGWHIFFSNFCINIYTNSNIFILGLFVNKTLLGYYSIAEKCFMAFRQILGVFFQSIYPRACVFAKESHEQLIGFYHKVFVKFLALIAVACTGVFFAADLITLVFTHSYNEQVSSLIRLLSFAPLVIALNVPAYQTIIIYSLKRSYTIVLLAGSIISVLLNVFLAKNYLAHGTIAAIYITEAFITISLYIAIEMPSSKYSIIKMFSTKAKPSLS